ncbi:MAG: alpha-2-macroglobulin, partial [Zavarzinella sp.]|nr:alpha-2-macroglobulin [Zavarzinella sp.]
MSAVWMRWGVAASLLFVFVGLGGPAAYQVIGWSVHSREANGLKAAVAQHRDELRRLERDHQEQREAVQREYDQAVAAHKAVENAYRDALAGARKAIEEKDFVVRLTGPERAQPGAPNEWKIETLTKEGRHALPQKVEVVVKDQTDAELLRETHTGAITGSPSLKLPPEFWDRVKPGSDLYLEVVAQTDDNRRSVLAERLPLAGPVYVTHLVTDRPMYQPGDTIRFRSLTLDRATFLPPDRDLNLNFRLKKPDGAVVPVGEGNGRVVTQDLKPVLGPDRKPLRGLATGEHVLEDDAPLGEYVLEVVDLRGPGPLEKVLESRKFLVQKYVIEKFEKRLEFDGKSYGPGDQVRARIEVTRTGGQAMKNAVADVVVSTGDGRAIHKESGVRFEVVPDAGQQPQPVVARVRFTLPADLAANRKPSDPPVQVSMSVTIRDGEDTETIVRPVPLVEHELKVEFFPEGGDLVEAVPGRVYFEVRTPSGKPADLKGVITDGTDTVAEVATLTDADHAGVNRGHGVFSLTPQPGKKYFLKLRAPTGIHEPTKDGFPLPAAKSDGVVLTALEPVFEKGAPIRVQVQVGKGPKTLHVGAYARGRLIGQERIEVEAGKPVEVKLAGEASLGGVTRVTVFEEAKEQGKQRAILIPRAERLVFRRPGERLDLSVTPDKDRYTPAGKVALDLAAANEKGRPVPAILLVAVINQSVIAMADNKTDRLLPTHFLLAGEIKHPADLEHADFLLTGHPKAAEALDLLLGTQGWRRFAEQNVLPADPAERQEVERLLVASGSRASVPVEQVRVAEERVAAEFQPKVEETAPRAAAAQAALMEYRTTIEPHRKLEADAAKSRLEVEEGSYQKAAHDLYEFETRNERPQSLVNWALPAFLLGLIALTAAAVAFAVRRRPGERRPFVLTAVGAVAVAVLVVGGIILTHGTPESEQAYVALEQERNQPGIKSGGVAAVPGPRVDQGKGVNPVLGKDHGPPPAPVRADTGPEKGTIPVRAERLRGAGRKADTEIQDPKSERLANLE